VKFSEVRAVPRKSVFTLAWNSAYGRLRSNGQAIAFYSCGDPPSLK